MNGGILFLIAFAISGRCCLATRLDIGIAGIPGSGFFMQPFYPMHNDTTTQEWPFVMLPGLQSITASYGPFASEAGILSPELISKNADLSGTLHVVDNYVISASLVQRSATHLQPRLQIVFHASRDAGSSDAGGKSGATQGRYRAEHGFQRSVQICAIMYAQRGAEEMISTCIITGSASDFACVADLVVPHHWWHPTQNRTVDVFYSAFSAGNDRRCAALAETIDGKYDKVNSEFADGLRDKRLFVSSVNLVSDLSNYGEMREDQHLLIYVPEVAITPGSLFHVPVKLQAESDLQVFVIRVKCRNGVRVYGADISDTSTWHITTDITQKGRGAVITASVRNDTRYSKMESVQDLFSWLFEVDAVTDGEDRGRLIFSLEYEMTSSRKETFAPVRNKATAFIRYQTDNLYTIVPVVKTLELVNTAILTGQTLKWPMRVYSLSDLGQTIDVTMRSTCYSQNEHVMQASVTCDFVYFDGNETQGSSSTGVIVKFGQQSRMMYFRVWIPELPLEIELSDNTLSMIAGWKVPSFPPPSSRARSSRQAVSDAKTETAAKAGTNKEEKLSVCPRLRYQSALAEVYARFQLSDTQSPTYLVHRKAQFRVTHLVRHRLRVADVSVARLRDGNVIDGVKAGRTEVQVMSNTGRAIGMCMLTVTTDRVNIQKIDVSVVSGVSLSLDAKSVFPGSMAVRVTKTRSMHHKYQEAMLDLTLRTDDGASFPVGSLGDGEYTLAAETLNHNIVTLAPPHLAHTVTVMAVMPGSGDLVRVSFGTSDLCPTQKQQPRPLAVGLGFVDIDFDELTQSDASYYHHRLDFDRLDTSRQDKTGGLLLEAPDDRRQQPRKNGRKQKGKFGPSAAEISSDRPGGVQSETVETIPRNEAQKQQPVMEAAKGTSSLEMAMYVLLAVFSVSVVIFAANCLLFVVRHRQKRKLPETKEPVAEVRDWVWIGRSTLERNEVDIKCGRRLMSDDDFNSNLCRRPASGASLLQPPGGSNRNSTVSTYRGSECSVRITSNPLADDNGNVLDGTVAPVPSLASSSPPKVAESIIRPEAYTVDKKENAESQTTEDCEVTKSVTRGMSAGKSSTGRSFGPTSSAWSTMSREEQLRELEEVVANGSGAEWDYEAFGMTYHELMDYFDNLKESTA